MGTEALLIGRPGWISSGRSPTRPRHDRAFAGGNRPIGVARRTLGQRVRDRDVVGVGFLPKDDPEMLRKDIALFEERVERAGG